MFTAITPLPWNHFDSWLSTTKCFSFSIFYRKVSVFGRVHTLNTSSNRHHSVPCSLPKEPEGICLLREDLSSEMRFTCSFNANKKRTYGAVPIREFLPPKICVGVSIEAFQLHLEPNNVHLMSHAVSQKWLQMRLGR